MILIDFRWYIFRFDKFIILSHVDTKQMYSIITNIVHNTSVYRHVCITSKN